MSYLKRFSDEISYVKCELKFRMLEHRFVSFSFLITLSLCRCVVSGDQGGDLSAPPWESVPLETETRAQPRDWRPARACQVWQPPVFLELVKRHFGFSPLNPPMLPSDISRTRKMDSSGTGAPPAASVCYPTCKNVLNKHSTSCWGLKKFHSNWACDFIVCCHPGTQTLPHFTRGAHIYFYLFTYLFIYMFLFCF